MSAVTEVQLHAQGSTNIITKDLVLRNWSYFLRRRKGMEFALKKYVPSPTITALHLICYEFLTSNNNQTMMSYELEVKSARNTRKD
jgi:hypothetical protein